MAEGNLNVEPSISTEHNPPIAISQEIINKFSQGEINVGDGMTINGDGEARRLRVMLSPGDTDWQTYKDQLDSISMQSRHSIEDTTQTIEKTRQALHGITENEALKARLSSAEKGYDPYQGPLGETLANTTQSVHEEQDSTVVELEKSMINRALDSANFRRQQLLATIVTTKIGRILDRKDPILGQIRETLQGDKWDDPSVMKHRQGLYSQLSKISELYQYASYMYHEKRAFEVTVTENQDQEKK